MLLGALALNLAAPVVAFAEESAKPKDVAAQQEQNKDGGNENADQNNQDSEKGGEEKKKAPKKGINKVWMIGSGVALVALLTGAYFYLGQDDEQN